MHTLNWECKFKMKINESNYAHFSKNNFGVLLWIMSVQQTVFSMQAGTSWEEQLYHREFSYNHWSRLDFWGEMLQQRMFMTVRLFPKTAYTADILFYLAGILHQNDRPDMLAYICEIRIRCTYCWHQIPNYYYKIYWR